MESPEESPLAPCAICGAVAAVPLPLGEKKNQICFGCDRRSRKPRAILAVVLMFGVVLVFIWSRQKGPSLPEEEPRMKLEPILVLMRKGELREARAKLQPLLRESPRQKVLNVLMGACLERLGYYESAVPYWEIALQGDEVSRERARLSLGVAHLRMGRPALALKQLEEPFADRIAEGMRPLLLGEAYLDLERYEETLAILPALPGDDEIAWARYRALSYLGREEEVRGVVEGLRSPVLRAKFLAERAREAGDFEEAHRALDAVADRRATLPLHLEAGDLTAFRSTAEELSKEEDLQTRGDGLWCLALAALAEGDREAAIRAAREFLDRIDPEYTPLRLERMMMAHLVGDLNDAALDAEGKATSRFRANDIYYYLALSTGNREWAVRALEVTPGHNFPYHAIRRLQEP